MRRVTHLVLPLLLVALVTAAARSEGSAAAAHRRTTAPSVVVVPRGRPVQIAYVGASDIPSFTESFRNAIQMAIEDHPAVRGFSIQVSELDAPCGSPDTAAASATVATRIVSNRQNLGVLGNPCSTGERAALPVYESAGIVAISGSATAGDLPALAPTVFDRTTVSDPDGFEAWYATVETLPSDLAFVEDYEAEFDSTPTVYADLYYDAASLLLRRLSQISRLDRDGNLVVDRARLASAVRATRWYRGVSCRVTLDSSGNRVNDPAALAACGQG
jgi:ABC-type branched-subunit amino acid transport system substrate-binding protein